MTLRRRFRVQNVTVFAIVTVIRIRIPNDLHSYMESIVFHVAPLLFTCFANVAFVCRFNQVT